MSVITICNSQYGPQRWIMSERPVFNSINRMQSLLKVMTILLSDTCQKIIKTLFFILMERRKHYVHRHCKAEVFIGA